MRICLGWLVVLACACSSKTPGEGGPPGDGGPGVSMCPTGTQLCTGSCVNLLTDDKNCSACGQACPAMQGCAGGRCYDTACGGVDCGTGRVCLSGECVDRACFGLVCPAGQVCAAGACYPGDCVSAICTATQVCYDGGCADTSCIGVLCPSGAVCQAGACRIDTCGDGVQNGDETGIDCGGSCGPCEPGMDCTVAKDCDSRVCGDAGTCRPPSCSDGVRNGQEGDVDCGGACPPCANGLTCTLAAQCASKVCTMGVCQVPTCTDGVLNGAETAKDCGGGCPVCADGSHCDAGTDCQSAQCVLNVCSSASCMNGMPDPGETGLDCGGAVCPPCGVGKGCDGGTDCISHVCGATKLCSAGTCGDHFQNGNETDVDCGGGTCSGCDAGYDCLVGGDCVSKICTPQLKCTAATCTDMVINGTETDTDCGGGTCPKCVASKHCIVSGDCQGICDAGVCSVPPLFGLRAPRALAVGTTPMDLAVADLDGDGKADVAITNFGSDDINVNWGNGDGTFTSPAGIAISGINGDQGGSDIAIGDFDGDGKLDLAVARTHGVGCCTGYQECAATTVRNAGGRTWFGGVDLVVTGGGGCLNSAWAGKINSDSKDDVIFGGQLGTSADGPAWLFTGATGGLSGGLRIGANPSTGGSWVTGGDVNRDTNIDIIARNTQSSTVFVYLNQGGGAFQTDAGIPLGVAGGSGDIIVAQVNADTFPDLIVGSDTSGRVEVAFGNGDGTFLAPAAYPAPGAHGVAFGDVTGDGVPDLVVGGTGLFVLKGNGDGTFQPALTFFPTYKLTTTVLMDFDGDGKLDVVAITSLSNVLGATVFLQGP